MDQSGVKREKEAPRVGLVKEKKERSKKLRSSYRRVSPLCSPSPSVRHRCPLCSLPPFSHHFLALPRLLATSHKLGTCGPSLAELDSSIVHRASTSSYRWQPAWRRILPGKSDRLRVWLRSNCIDDLAGVDGGTSHVHTSTRTSMDQHRR